MQVDRHRLPVPVQADVDRVERGHPATVRDAGPRAGLGGSRALVSDPHDGLRRVVTDLNFEVGGAAPESSRDALRPAGQVDRGNACWELHDVGVSEPSAFPTPDPHEVLLAIAAESQPCDT